VTVAAPSIDARGDGELEFDDAFLRKLERLAVVAKRVAALHGRGERQTRRVGSGIEFADHRDYAPGDDLRHLDWNLYGRLERPLVRLFDEDEDLPVYLLVDTSASMGLGRPSKLGLARAVAAALAYVSLTNLDRVAVHAASDGLASGLGLVRGKGQIHPFLDLLASWQPAGRTDLGAAVTSLVQRHRRRGVVVVISDFYDPIGFEQGLDRLRYGRFEPVVVQITAPDEAAPALRGELTVVDVETGEERAITITPGVAASYRQRYEARLRGLARFCRERAVPCFQVTSEQPLEDLVLRILRTGGLLK
jgi:uncharacterized protein (DUF58 family)